MLDTTAFILASLLDWLAKGFLIMGLAFLADLLMRRSHASLRHWVWLAGLGSCILIPLVSSFVPSLNTPIFHLNIFAAAPALGPEMAAAGPESGFHWSSSQALIGIYVAGLLLVLAWQSVGRFYAIHLRKHAARITDPHATWKLRRLTAELGIRTRVELLTSDRISIPFSTGYVRPVIVLPQATSRWPRPVLTSVLVHELTHIKRKDIFSRLVAQVGCCIHWINPLAWYGLGRIIMEQEIACDRRVLGTGTKPSEYARNLLALAKARRGRLDFALTALGRRTELRNRLVEILKPTRNAPQMRTGGALVFMGLTLGLILPVSALHIWDAPDTAALRELADSYWLPPVLPVPPGPVSPAVNSQTSKTPTELEIEAVKEKITNKLQEMKAGGVPQEQIEQFAAESKAKLASLQKEKMKKEKEIKQIEMKKQRSAKEVE
jgi:beta-lactamase regulating signal transducer with metallopeptidase domain